LYKYNIYLSYPTAPGNIYLHGNDSALLQTLTIENEPVFDESERKPTLLYPFNAYAANGNATGQLVFVNYCRESDFDTVMSLGITVKGKIMICKYGKGSRTMKTRYSEDRGAIGLIIYTDPKDHTYAGQEYPNGWMLNEYGVQRGTINRLPGDALSLGYPSKEKYFRVGEDKYTGNPAIPVQPISYGTAYHILSWMNDSSIELPADFQGGLNFTYSLQSGNKTIKLNVNTKLETKVSYTVCGKLYGSVEPDRYVMFGNHRDAWTYGACDPNSGTATMMEIVRSMGAHKKNGWRPRRSIMACSWGAEESGIQGSTEWADENHKFLKEQVVMYLNVDMAVEGNFTVRLKALDSTIGGVFTAAKNIQAPDDSSRTLYEDWRIKSAMLKKVPETDMEFPTYLTPTSGSDYKALWHAYGTPILDFRYYFSRLDFPSIPQNGHYHTRYESFGWMSKWVDPGFIHHQAIGRLWAGHAMVVADSNLLPINLYAFTKQVKGYLTKFQTAYQDMLDAQGITLDFAHERMDALVTKSNEFHMNVEKKMEKGIDLLKLRMINDKIMNFERAFLITGLLDTNPVIRHVVYATTYNKLKNEKFPGISEAIYMAKTKNLTDWDDVRKQITYVIWCFDTANRSLDMDE